MVAGNGELMNLFFQALEIKSPVERARYLHTACPHDQQLRGRLEELLRAHGEIGDFLEDPLSTLPAHRFSFSTATLAGTAIGPYRLLRQLGDGGMGVVFEAEQTRPVRRRVALKLIKPGMDTDEVLARFDAERQALALMDHPHIARVFDAGETDAGRPYFVMEFVDGLPVTEYCDQNCRGPRTRLNLFVQVCQAVQHAHQKGIIHRDIKPTNVLVVEQDGRPVPKVIDFGVAKALDQQLSSHTICTQAAQMIGTPLYMSPEQADRAGLDIDTRTDVYSLGVLLYELLVGTTPFDRDRIKQAPQEEVRRIIRDEDPPRPSQRLSTLRETASTVCASRKCEPKQLTSLLRGELDWIVMKALEKDRARRYESASALAVDVERYLNDEPVQACPPSRLYQARKFARRHKLMLTTVLLVTAALLGGSSVAVWQALRATQAQRVSRNSELEVRRMLYAADVRLAADAWERNDMARMRDVLSRQLPQEGQPDFRGFEWYYLWKQTGVTSQVLVQGESAIYFACFSPDARWLVVTGADAVIHLFDGTTYVPAGTIESGQTEVNGLAFSPDSRTLASAGDDGRIALWDPVTRELQFAFHAHDAIVFQVAWSPDGAMLASCADEPVIRLWDAATGASRGTLERHTDVVEAITISPHGLLAAAANDRGVSLWRLDTRDCVRFDSGPEGTSPDCVALSDDGRLIADGRANGVVTIRDLNEPDRIDARHAVSAGVASVAFSPDSRWLAVGDDSGDATLIALQTEISLESAAFSAEPAPRGMAWHAHDARLYSVTFSAEGRHLVTCGKDGRAVVWSLETNPARQVLDIAARHLAFASDGGMFSAGESICRQASGPADDTRTLESTAGPWVWVGIAQQTGMLCARSGTDNGIHAWNGAGKPLGQLWPSPGPLQAHPFAVSPDGRRLAIQNRDAHGELFLEIYDTTSQQTLSRTPSGAALDLAFSPDGRWFSFSRSTEVLILNADSGAIRHVLAAHRKGAGGVAFSPDSRHLATVGDDRALNVWDVATGQREWSVVAHAIAAVDVAFSPDGQTLATVADDGMLRFWRWGVERLLLEVPLPTGQLRQVEFSPDGRRLVCRYRSGEVVIYDASPEVAATDAR